MWRTLYTLSLSLTSRDECEYVTKIKQKQKSKMLADTRVIQGKSEGLFKFQNTYFVFEVDIENCNLLFHFSTFLLF